MHTIPLASRRALGADPAPARPPGPPDGTERALSQTQWVAIFWAELRRLDPKVGDAKALRLASACCVMASHVRPERAAAAMAAGRVPG